MSDGPNNLADALAAQIARVSVKKERWQRMAQEHNMGPGMQVSIGAMQAAVERAVKSLVSDDVAEMIAAHKALAAYSDDD